MKLTVATYPGSTVGLLFLQRFRVGLLLSIGYLLSIKQSFFRCSHLLLVIKLISFSASGIVKLIHNWELTFKILSCHFFAFVYLNSLQTFKLK